MSSRIENPVPGRRSRLKRKLMIAVLFATLAVLVAACVRSGEDLAPEDYPIIPTSDLVASGEPLYRQQCYHCHGDTNRAPLTQNIPTHTDAGHTWHHADQMLVEWILDGVPLGTQMPNFRGQLTPQEVKSVVAYIKTLWPADVRQFQMEGSIQYKQRAGGPR